MAEHGAHLSSSNLPETDRPSIFEVIAQQSLSATLHPAIGHAVKVFAEKYPEQLGPILCYYDEIYLLFDTVVQSYYLKKYGGSFAENFYGLKRVASRTPDLLGLSRKIRLRALVCLVLIPYLKQKLQATYEQLLYELGESGRSKLFQRSASLRQRLTSLYMLCFPYISSAWELLTLTYQLTYMLRAGRWHSPSMQLSHTELRHMDGEEGTNLGLGLSATWAGLSLIEKLRGACNIAANFGAVCLSTSLSVSVFFLQFLDWWYASDASSAALTALPVPPPPTPESVKDVHCSVCPLCSRERVNSTALSVSGYVFCYTCINEYVCRNKCCPVTGYSATDEHLVKIYEQAL